jgi:hypothetical protein
MTEHDHQVAQSNISCIQGNHISDNNKHNIADHQCKFREDQLKIPLLTKLTLVTSRISRLGAF